MLRDNTRSHGAKIAFLTNAMSLFQAVYSEDNYTLSLKTSIRLLTELTNCVILQCVPTHRGMHEHIKVESLAKEGACKRANRRFQYIWKDKGCDQASHDEQITEETTGRQ